MPLNLTNSTDIVANSIHIVQNNDLTNILDLITTAGSSGLTQAQVEALINAAAVTSVTPGVGEYELISNNTMRVFGSGGTVDLNLFGTTFFFEINSQYPTSVVFPALLTALGGSAPNTLANWICTANNLGSNMLMAAAGLAANNIPSQTFILQSDLEGFMTTVEADRGYEMELNPIGGSTWWEGVRLKPTVVSGYPNAEAYLHLTNTYTGSAILAGGQFVQLRRGGGVMLSCEATGTLVYGALNCTGTFTAGVKNFLIDYPGKPDKQIKHSCIEGNKPRNIYTFKGVELASGENVLQLPEYFKLINAEPMVITSSFKHFGLSYGEVIDNNCIITTNQAGKYNVLVIADRSDSAVDGWTDVVDKPPP